MAIGSKNTNPVEVLPCPELHMTLTNLGWHLWQDLFLLQPLVDHQFFHRSTIPNKSKNNITSCSADDYGGSKNSEAFWKGSRNKSPFIFLKAKAKQMNASASPHVCTVVPPRVKGLDYRINLTLESLGRSVTLFREFLE